MPKYVVTVKDANQEAVLRNWRTEADDLLGAVVKATTEISTTKGTLALHHAAVGPDEQGEGTRDHELFFFKVDKWGNSHPVHAGKATFHSGY